MTLLEKITGATLHGVAVGQSPEVFSEIHKSGNAAAIWDRQPLANFQDWINGLKPDDLPRVRAVLRATAVPDALAALFDASPVPNSPERQMLIDDISALADMFATVMDTKYLRMRLDVINTNACRKFHVDAITARLICTYRGTGTQYGKGESGHDPAEIYTLQAGVPLILRGTSWPETPRSGLLHRSPPIEGTGETRFVLVLDPAKAMDEDDVPVHYMH